MIKIDVSKLYAIGETADAPVAPPATSDDWMRLCLTYVERGPLDRQQRARLVDHYDLSYSERARMALRHGELTADVRAYYDI
jgi:hypothetical protein